MRELPSLWARSEGWKQPGWQSLISSYPLGLCSAHKVPFIGRNKRGSSSFFATAICICHPPDFSQTLQKGRQPSPSVGDKETKAQRCLLLVQRHAERAPIKDKACPHLQCTRYSLPSCLLSVFENLLMGSRGQIKHIPCLMHGRLSIQGCDLGEEEHFAQCLGSVKVSPQTKCSGVQRMLEFGKIQTHS